MSVFSRAVAERGMEAADEEAPAEVPAAPPVLGLDDGGGDDPPNNRAAPAAAELDVLLRR